MVDYVVDPEELLFQFASTNGAGGGTINAVGNYSVVTGRFYVQPPVAEVYAIERLTIEITDYSGLRSNRYGGGPPLANGVTIKIKSGGPTGAVLKTLTPLPVKTNEAWTKYATVDEPRFVAPNTTDTLAVTWDFKSAFSLVGGNSECVVVELNDNLAALNEHTFLFQGVSV